MWIVRLALNRPYTFVVVSILILVGILAIFRTPTDIFTGPSAIWAIGGSPAMTLLDGGRRRAATDVANYRQTTLTAFQQVEDDLAALGVLEHEASKMPR